MRRFLANFIFSFQLQRFVWSNRPRFRRWIELEELKDHFIRAAEEGTDLPQALARLLSAALGISPRLLKHIEWWKQFSAFNTVCIKNQPRILLPILTDSSSRKQDRDLWDYPDRMWYLYAHIIAKAFGWTFGEISQLNVEDAIAIIQEILTDEQLQREFDWGLSERAFSYDPKSKVSKYNELPRPYWMKPKVSSVVKKIKILKAMMPVGNVNYDAVDEANRPKEVSQPQASLPRGNVGPL